MTSKISGLTDKILPVILLATVASDSFANIPLKLPQSLETKDFLCLEYVKS